MTLPPFSCRIVCSLIALRGGKILLLKRSPRGYVRNGAWDLPGGILEEGEDLAKSVTREFSEETELKLVSKPKIVHAESSVEAGVFWIKLVFQANASKGEVAISKEHTEFRWLLPSDAARMDYGIGGEFQRNAIRKLCR